MKYPEFPNDSTMQEIVRRCKINFTVYLTWDERDKLNDYLHPAHMTWESTWRPSELRALIWQAYEDVFKKVGDKVAAKLLGELI